MRHWNHYQPELNRLYAFFRTAQVPVILVSGDKPKNRPGSLHVLAASSKTVSLVSFGMRKSPVVYPIRDF